MTTQQHNRSLFIAGKANVNFSIPFPLSKSESKGFNVDWPKNAHIFNNSVLVFNNMAWGEGGRKKGRGEGRGKGGKRK